MIDRWNDILNTWEKDKVHRWDQILEVWESENVPELKIYPFNSKSHDPFLVWFWLDEQRQFDCSSNPLNRTAVHIVKDLKDANKELMVAYKLLAFSRSHGSLAFEELKYILEYALNKYGYSSRDWWSSNSKNVIPLFQGNDTNSLTAPFIINESLDVLELVKYAAQEWSVVANNVGIIRVPALMDKNSGDYLKYIEDCESN